VIITTDASPWGFGATLHLQGVLVAALTDELQEDDLARFNLQKGDCRGQSLWEAMAELIAARTWKDWWLGQPWSLCLRGDSTAALGALGKLSSPSQQMNAVCREMALDLAEGAYRVTVLEHVEGKLNLLPDCLSRLCEPGSAKQRPVELVGVKFTEVERRSQAWWRTRLEPG
jgi:hypothetical protein